MDAFISPSANTSDTSVEGQGKRRYRWKAHYSEFLTIDELLQKSAKTNLLLLLAECCFDEDKHIIYMRLKDPKKIESFKKFDTLLYRVESWNDTRGVERFAGETLVYKSKKALNQYALKYKSAVNKTNKSAFPTLNLSSPCTYEQMLQVVIFGRIPPTALDKYFIETRDMSSHLEFDKFREDLRKKEINLLETDSKFFIEPTNTVILSALKLAGYNFDINNNEAQKWNELANGYKQLKMTPASQNSTSCLSSPTPITPENVQAIVTSRVTSQASPEISPKKSNPYDNYKVDGLPVSEVIKSRIRESNGGFYCNENISQFIKEGEMGLLVNEVTTKFQGVLESLVINTDEDHNTQDTAHRVAKMYIQEIFSGRFEKKPKVTAFPNHLQYDQMYVTGPIMVRSMCAHHMMPIQGSCYVGVFPDKKVIGLSKFNRIVEWVCSRPQIQEEMTVQVAEEIQRVTEAESIAVIIRAEHGCMTMRGVKTHESDMTTSVMKGKFKEDSSLKNEFLQHVSQMKK